MNGAEALKPYAGWLSSPFNQAAADLDGFAALLLKWNAVQNLVSRETVGEIWPRHIVDSLQLLPLLRASDRLIIDIGSGGGFPAIPLAIASRETERRFTLLEPVGKKASFLRTAGRELKLAVTVEALRAEQFDSRETADLVTSRALAPLSDLLGMGIRILGASSHMLLHKGREYREEMRQAAALYDFDVLVNSSVTDAEGVVLDISNLRVKTAL